MLKRGEGHDELFYVYDCRCLAGWKKAGDFWLADAVLFCAFFVFSDLLEVAWSKEGILSPIAVVSGNDSRPASLVSPGRMYGGSCTAAA